MNNYIVGHIRTFVPIAVGWVLAWLGNKFGIVDLNELGPEMSAALVSFLSALYYGLIRALAERWPWVGAFLGVNKAPDYAR